MRFRLGYYYRRTRTTIIHLSENIEAETLEGALKIGLQRAHENEWTLEEVTEL